MILIHAIPVYWGIEEDAPDRTFFTRAFLNEALPPYRESFSAIRIRVSHRHWLHVGIFKYRTEVVKGWGMDDVQPYEIGKWGLEREEEEESGGWLDDPGVEVRSMAGSGPDQLRRVGDAPDGGTVPGSVPPGTGSGLGTDGNGDTR